jgi:hypothetical protein
MEAAAFNFATTMDRQAVIWFAFHDVRETCRHKDVGGVAVIEMSYCRSVGHLTSS